MKIINKIINHFTLNGNKETGEKNLIKSIKNLLKISNKNSRDVLKLALVFTIPIFKLHKIKIKRKKKKTIKEIPEFIKNKQARISLAIKFILKNVKQKEKIYIFNNKFTKEILLNAINKGNTIQFKKDVQQNVLTKKRFLIFYRWN